MQLSDHILSLDKKKKSPACPFCHQLCIMKFCASPAAIVNTDRQTVAELDSVVALLDGSYRSRPKMKPLHTDFNKHNHDVHYGNRISEALLLQSQHVTSSR